MSVAGDRSAGARPARSWRWENPLIALWLLLPACVWWIDFGSALFRASSTRWVWGPVCISLGLWLLGTVVRAVAGSPPEVATDPSIRAATPNSWRAAAGTALFLLAGAAFLVLLGPGIAPIRDSAARGLVGALMITCAWAGWTALHPETRRIAFRLLRSIRRG